MLLFLILFVILSTIFLISVSFYRALELVDGYFPGFFIYSTRAINIYEIPEWWEGRKQNIPPKAILLKLNNFEIKNPKDYWDIVYKNLRAPQEYNVEYRYNNETFVKVISAQKFELKDYIFFSVFWQLSGLLLIVTGVIIFLGNSGKKGSMWLIASILTGLNFVLTPVSSLFSDYPIIYFFERLTFSFFPASLLLLFLNFPLVKFSRTLRLTIISIVLGIGISVFFMSLLAYFYSEDLIQFQEMYYWYPGIGGISVVFSPIYDYFRLKKLRFYQFANAVLPIALSGVIFILIPSLIALVVSFSSIPSYYIPIFILFYPLVPIVSLMVNATRYFRFVSIGMILVLIISVVFSVFSLLIYFFVPFLQPPLRFIIIIVFSIVLSNFVFKLLFDTFITKGNFYEIDKVKLDYLLNRVKFFSTIEGLIKFLNSDFGSIMGFSFSKFLLHKFLPKDLKKLLMIMNSNFLTKESLERCCKDLDDWFLKQLSMATDYVVVLKHQKKFFGILLLGKRIGGNKLTKKEIFTMNMIATILSEYFAFLVMYMTLKEVETQKFLGVNQFLTKFLLKPFKVSYENFSLSIYVGQDTLKPIIYKVKDFGKEVCFCIVWLPSESIHPFLINLVIKGFLEDCFHNGLMNFNRISREIRNFVARVTSVELDVNILIGSINKSSNVMKVLNDGKTSIFLVTKRNSFVVMPLYKREFDFTKIKEGDTFFFVTAEEISHQVKEIEEMKVERFRVKKFLREINSELVMEINFFSKVHL